MSLELVNGPLSLWWAPLGTVFPPIDVLPAAEWIEIGTSGPNNFTEDGVVLAFDKTFEVFRGLGNTYPLKTFLTETDAFVRVTMADISIDQLRLAFNLNSIVTTAPAAGIAGTKTIDLDVSSTVAEMSLLVRGIGKSPEFAGGNVQFEFDRVAEAGSSEITFVKGEAAAVNLEFRVLLDDSGGFPGTIGRMISQTADPI